MKNIKYLGVMMGTLVTAGAAGCDQQAEAGYEGEPLLQIQGSVTVPSGAGGDLVPALVFEPWGREVGHLVMEVEVTGEFPSDFTLGVYEPPPSDVFRGAEALGGMWAEARIGAVASAHPARMWPAVQSTPADADCVWLDPPEPTHCRSQETLSWCGQDPRDPGNGEIDTSSCHSLAYDCPNTFLTETGTNVFTPLKVPEDCEGAAVASGDPALGVAGFSKNYGVVYFPADIPADSIVSFYFAAGAAIPAGYHLFNSNQPVADLTCMTQAHDLATQRWQESGLTTDTEEGVVLQMKLPYLAARELGCPLARSPIVPNPAGSPISIELAAQLIPVTPTP